MWKFFSKVRIKGLLKNALICANFNSQNRVLGSTKSDLAGNSLCEAISESEICILNDKSSTRVSVKLIIVSHIIESTNIKQHISLPDLTLTSVEKSIYLLEYSRNV